LAPVSRAVLRAAHVAEAGYTADREDGGWSACCVAHPWRAARPAGADFPFLRPPGSRSAINNSINPSIRSRPIAAVKGAILDGLRNMRGADGLRTVQIGDGA